MVFFIAVSTEMSEENEGWFDREDLSREPCSLRVVAIGRETKNHRRRLDVPMPGKCTARRSETLQPSLRLESNGSASSGSLGSSSIRRWPHSSRGNVEEIKTFSSSIVYRCTKISRGFPRRFDEHWRLRKRTRLVAVRLTTAVVWSDE